MRWVEVEVGGVLSHLRWQRFDIRQVFPSYPRLWNFEDTCELRRNASFSIMMITIPKEKTRKMHMLFILRKDK